MPAPDLAALESSLAKMTPGPWVLEDADCDVGPYINAPDAPGDGCVVCDSPFSDRKSWDKPDTPPPSVVAWKESNAAGIVAIVNAAPALIAMARRGEQAAALVKECLSMLNEERLGNQNDEDYRLTALLVRLDSFTTEAT